MGIWNSIEKYILNTSIFVSIQPIFYIMATLTLFGIEMDWKLGLISVLSAFFAYTVNKATDIDEDLINNPKKYLFYEKHGKTFYVLAALSYLLALYISFEYSYITTLIVFIPLILGIAYSVKWIPGSGYKRIKDIPGGKTLVLSFAWASVILLTNYYVGFTPTLLSLFFYVFLIEFMAALAFDVRDIRGDRRAGVKTIAVIFGKKTTMIILHILNLISLAFLLLIVYSNILPITMLAVSIGMFLFFILSFKMMLTNISKTMIYDLFLESLTIFFLSFTFVGILLF